MRLSEIDNYFRSVLEIDQLAKTDASMNGIQVGAANGIPEDAEVERIAFAVDACMETFERAAEGGAQMLFVHHGLFWGRSVQVDGAHFRRLKYLFKNDLALYAAHLPLDLHPEFGNNAGICAALGIEEPHPFGEYHGFQIGFKGNLPEPSSLDDVLASLGLSADNALSVLPFGPARIKKIAVISGGGTNEIDQAIDEKADLYITGDAAHQIYHTCLENGINLISAGHYNTETWGVRLLAEKTAEDIDVETFFVDVPTGL